MNRKGLTQLKKERSFGEVHRWKRTTSNTNNIFKTLSKRNEAISNNHHQSPFWVNQHGHERSFIFHLFFPIQLSGGKFPSPRSYRLSCSPPMLEHLQEEILFIESADTTRFSGWKTWGIQIFRTGRGFLGFVETNLFHDIPNFCPKNERPKKLSPTFSFWWQWSV